MPEETAMLLAHQEWDDLEAMVVHYKASTDWIKSTRARNLEHDRFPEHVEAIERRRKLADRIIEANQPV